MFLINNKYLCIILYLIQYGTIFVKQNYFAHFRFINEQRDCDATSCHFKTTSRIVNRYEAGGCMEKNRTNQSEVFK